MRPFTNCCTFLLYLALVPGTMVACSAYTPQRIERDIAQWHPYYFRLDDTLYRIQIPPGAMIIKQPVTDVSTDSVDDYFIAAAFGFDFGRGTYNDIAQVELGVSVSRINDGISCVEEESRFGECILQDSKVSVKGNMNQYQTFGLLQWFHESGTRLPWDGYSILVSRDHYLTIEGHYWEDLVERPDMLADRRKLVEEIVRTVQILN